MIADDFIAAARGMLGVPFKHQGRSPRFGLDCAGLAVCAARQCGLNVEDFTAYQRLPNTSDFLATLHKNCDRLLAGEERPGDLLIFEFSNNPQHLAILTAPGRIIHAYGAGAIAKVVEHDMDATWRAKQRAAFRLREI